MTFPFSLRALGKKGSFSLVSRASPLVAARIVAATLGMIVPLLLARSFLPEEYGTYKQLLLISQTLFYILPCGMTQSLFYFLPRDTKSTAYLTQTLLFLVAVGIVGALGLNLAGNSLGEWFNNPFLAKFSGIISIYTFGIIASSPLEIVWTARGQTVYAAIVILISELTKAAAWTIPVVCGLGLEGTILGMTGYSMTRLLVTWGIHFRVSKKIWRPEIWFAQLRYALPLGAAVALMVPQQALHQYLISAQLGAALFAAYSVAIFQMPIFDLFYGPMSEILMVRVAELDKEGRSADAAKTFLSTVQKLIFFFVPIIVLLICFAPNIIEVLFTQKYLSSAPIFRVATCAGLLACIPVEGALRAKGQTRSLFLGSMIKLIITIPLVIWGIRYWELMGGIVAWLIAETIAKLFWVHRLQKVMNITRNLLVPWGKKECPALALATLGATIGTLGIQKHFPEFNGALWLGTLSACFGIIYLCIFWLVQNRMQSAREATIQARPID